MMEEQWIPDKTKIHVFSNQEKNNMSQKDVAPLDHLIDECADELEEKYGFVVFTQSPSDL